MARFSFVAAVMIFAASACDTEQTSTKKEAKDGVNSSGEHPECSSEPVATKCGSPSQESTPEKSVDEPEVEVKPETPSLSLTDRFWNQVKNKTLNATLFSGGKEFVSECFEIGDGPGKCVRFRSMDDKFKTRESEFDCKVSVNADDLNFALNGEGQPEILYSFPWDENSDLAAGTKEERPSGDYVVWSLDHTGKCAGLENVSKSLRERMAGKSLLSMETGSGNYHRFECLKFESLPGPCAIWTSFDGNMKLIGNGTCDVGDDLSTTFLDIKCDVAGECGSSKQMLISLGTKQDFDYKLSAWEGTDQYGTHKVTIGDDLCQPRIGVAKSIYDKMTISQILIQDSTQYKCVEFNSATGVCTRRSLSSPSLPVETFSCIPEAGPSSLAIRCAPGEDHCGSFTFTDMLFYDETSHTPEIMTFTDPGTFVYRWKIGASVCDDWTP